MFLFVDVFMFENIYRVDCVTSFWYRKYTRYIPRITGRV
jgi:hypothetical protein